MAGPPPKPKKEPDDLAEVERALSVLKGRHPEHERVQREEAMRSARLRADREANAAVAQSASRKKIAKYGAIGVVVLAALVVIVLSLRREIVRRGHVEQSSDAYRAAGFVVAETSSRSSAGKLESTEEPGCFVVASTDDAPIHVDFAGKKVEGNAPVLFCTCQKDKIAASSEVTDNGGLTLLRIDAATIGGSRAFAFAPFKAGAIGRFDEGCDDAALDAWIAAKKFPPPIADESWLTATPARAPLAAVAKVLATFDVPAPFAIVDVPKETCLLVTSSNAFDKIALRQTGGTIAVSATGGLVWCASAEWSPLVQRDGDGKVAVIAVPAQSVGGTLGMRDLVAKAALVVSSISVAPADHGWNARQLLLAMAVPESLIKTSALPDIAKDPEARMAALSFGTPNAIAPESAADTFSYCEPPIVDTTRETVCLFSGEPTLRPSSAEAVGAAASAKLPFWLFGLQGANDPVALRQAALLAALARRLKHENFEPTTIEAMTELPNGVEILGRVGEDAVVAASVMPGEPWIVPLTDGPAWPLDGVPRVVPIQPLHKITLTMALEDWKIRKLPPKDKRRTVVFRRALPKT
ncbi:MAG TPA: hypothetical protein VIF62_06190 [Labilithrix sp.]